MRRSSRSRKKKKNTVYLPHELVFQILLRLPVKSLIQFKCVCKSWLSLISDTHFSNSHFQLTTATHTRRIAIIPNLPTEIIRSVDLEASLKDDCASSSRTLNFLHSESYSHLEFHGSCRGFILLHCDSSLYLWNPSTGFHTKIPHLASNSNSHAQHFYGFGYDQSRDDYLVVSIFYYRISSHLVFFSLRDNIWKEIEFTHIPYTDAFCNDTPKVGSLYNGAIHWLAYHRYVPRDVIVAFDLTEKKVFEIPLPCGFEHNLGYCGLWVFKENLSLWAVDYEHNIVGIWVMKEYNVSSSWTMTLLLAIDATPNLEFFPLCCTRSGDIIGTDGCIGLVKFDDNERLLEHSSYCEGPCVASKVIMYTESLLPLPGGNEDDTNKKNEANCIDSTVPAEAVFSSEVNKLKADQFKPFEQVTLEPFERDHACVVGGYRVLKKKKDAE